MFTAVLVALPALLTAVYAVLLTRGTRLRDAPRLPWAHCLAVALLGMSLPVLARVPIALLTSQDILPIWNGDAALWAVHAVPVLLTTVVAWGYGRAVPVVARVTAAGALCLPMMFHAISPLLEGSSDAAMGIALLFGIVYAVTLLLAPGAFFVVLFGLRLRRSR